MDLLSLLRLFSGAELLALLRLVWRWVRPAQHRRATVHDLQLRDCTAPTFVSGAAYSTADSKTFSGAASSPTTASMKRRSDSNNTDAAYPKNLRKIADADDSLAATATDADPKDMDADLDDSTATDADTKDSKAPTSASSASLSGAGATATASKNHLEVSENRSQDSKNADAFSSSLAAKNADASKKLLDAQDTTAKNVATAKNGSTSLSGAGSKNADAFSSSLAANPKNCGKIAGPSSSLAANPRGTKAPRAKARTGSTAFLFHARCPHCDWQGRVSMDVLAEHATDCRPRRFVMEQRLREEREIKAARAKAKRGRLKK